MAAPGTTVRPRPAARPAVGLLISASLITDPDLRWGNGFRYEPDPCSGSGVYNPCEMVTLDVPASPDIRNYEPFVVWAGDECTTMDAGRDREARARRLLAKCESAAIASELWTGTLAQAKGWPNAFLASSDADLVASSATPTEALACLEQYLAECSCGERGMIHATRQVVTHWAAAQLVRREGGVLTTAMDTIVVPDAGYDGSSRDGSPAADGSIWAYATSMVEVRLGEVNVESRINRTNNTHTVVAQRLAAASFDGCCLGAAEIDLPICTIGGVS